MRGRGGPLEENGPVKRWKIATQRSSTMSRNLSPVLRKQLENLDKDADNRKSALIAEETEADNERLEKDLEEIKLQIEELKKILVILIKTYGNGKTTISIYERKASIRQFYSVIFPALLQLQMGITDLDERGLHQNLSGVWKKQRIKVLKRVFRLKRGMIHIQLIFYLKQKGIKLSDETSSQDFEDNYQSKTDLLKAVAIFVAAATGTVAINHSWVAANQDLAMALLFVIGYAGIIFEESLAFNKSGVGLLMAVSLWVIRSIGVNIYLLYVLAFENVR
ncbi:hypothetical protein P8452_05823 [Trifolium repens]|nr:hypothetical protein P8452_05823 [Trifolium repens]